MECVHVEFNDWKEFFFKRIEYITTNVKYIFTCVVRHPDMCINDSCSKFNIYTQKCLFRSVIGTGRVYKELPVNVLQQPRSIKGNFEELRKISYRKVVKLEYF